ncbi:MAG: hypothetical protein JSS53_05465 [Proteobacteria bacterium]|nr:hypothetical protein [Pseudomonadota bacterium]
MPSTGTEKFETLFDGLLQYLKWFIDHRLSVQNPTHNLPSNAHLLIDLYTQIMGLKDSTGFLVDEDYKDAAVYLMGFLKTSVQEYKNIVNDEKITLAAVMLHMVLLVIKMGYVKEIDLNIDGNIKNASLDYEPIRLLVYYLGYEAQYEAVGGAQSALKTLDVFLTVTGEIDKATVEQFTNVQLFVKMIRTAFKEVSVGNVLLEALFKDRNTYDLVVTFFLDNSFSEVVVSWFCKIEKIEELKNFFNFFGALPNKELVRWIFERVKTNGDLKSYLNNVTLQTLSMKFFLSIPMPAIVQWVFRAEKLDELERYLSDDALRRLASQFFSSKAVRSMPNAELTNWIFENAKTVDDLKRYLADVELQNLSAKFLSSKPYPAMIKWCFQTKNLMRLKSYLKDAELQKSASQFFEPGDLRPVPNEPLVNWIFRARKPDKLKRRLEDTDLHTKAHDFFLMEPTTEQIETIFKISKLSELKDTLEKELANTEVALDDTEIVQNKSAIEEEDTSTSDDDDSSDYDSTSYSPSDSEKSDSEDELEESRSSKKTSIPIPTVDLSFLNRDVPNQIGDKKSGSPKGWGWLTALVTPRAGKPLPAGSVETSDKKDEKASSPSAPQSARPRTLSVNPVDKSSGQAGKPPLLRSNSGTIPTLQFGSNASKSMNSLPRPNMPDSKTSVPTPTPVTSPKGNIKTTPNSAPPNFPPESPKRPPGASPLSSNSSSPRSNSMIRGRTSSGLKTDELSSVLRKLGIKLLPPLSNYLPSGWSDEVKSKFSQKVKNASAFELLLCLLKDVKIQDWLERLQNEPEETIDKITDAVDLLWKTKVGLGTGDIFLHPLILLKIAAQPPHALEVAKVITELYMSEMTRLRCPSLAIEVFCQQLNDVEKKCPNLYLVCYELVAAKVAKWADKIFVDFEEFKVVIVNYHMFKYEKSKPAEQQTAVAKYFNQLAEMQRNFEDFYPACFQLEAARIPDWPKNISDIIEKYMQQKEKMTAFVIGLLTAIDILAVQNCLNRSTLLSLIATGQSIENNEQEYSKVIQEVAAAITVIHGLKLQLKKQWPSNEEEQLSDDWQTAFMDPKHVSNIASVIVMIPPGELTKNFLEMILLSTEYSQEIYKLCLAKFTERVDITERTFETVLLQIAPSSSTPTCA